MSSFVPAYTREMGELRGEQTTHLHCRNPLNTFCIRPPSERSFSKSFSITSAIHGISAVSAVVIHAISEHNVQLNTACSVWFFFLYSSHSFCVDPLAQQGTVWQKYDVELLRVTGCTSITA